MYLYKIHFMLQILSQYKFKYSLIIDAYVEAFSFKTFLFKANFDNVFQILYKNFLTCYPRL